MAFGYPQPRHGPCPCDAHGPCFGTSHTCARTDVDGARRHVNHFFGKAQSMTDADPMLVESGRREVPTVRGAAR